MKSIIRFIILVIGLAIGCSCKDTTSPVVKLFREHIGKEINLKGFEEVYSSRIPFHIVIFVKVDYGACFRCMVTNLPSIRCMR